MSLIGRRWHLRFAVLTLALSSLGSLTAACDEGGDKGGAGRSARAGACTAPEVTDSEVKAGLLFSDSGPGASALRGFRSGVEARFGLANAEGGVNG
ncbi:ABC transporter substrate-binding protein, partial [Candidatus Protofrankia californiensis]|uniref:ABC transporter substrate-binding protein n=1 Tax=Candidatus Protofrankia californiensis TaxID=1839754 RepID=UPI001F4946EF